MLPVLLRGAAWLTGPRQQGSPYFEVQTMRGVVDLLMAEVDESALVSRERWSLPPVVDAPAVAVLLALSRAEAVVDAAGSRALRVTELAPEVGMSESHLRRSVMPALADSGWLERSGDEWRARLRYQQPMRRIVAVEVKRDKWQKALAQAVHHTSFADATYVALDGARSPHVERASGAFFLAGVGLVAVHAPPAQRLVSKVIPAAQRRPRGLPRAVVSERVLALRASGARSGPVGHVFGRHLTTSGGEDPRRFLALSAKPVRPE